jgi:hypothetical protein
LRGAAGVFDGEWPALMGSGRCRRPRRPEEKKPRRPEEKKTRRQKREEDRAVLIPLNRTSPDVYREGLWV